MAQPIIIFQSGHYTYQQTEPTDLLIYVLCLTSADIQIEVEQLVPNAKVDIRALAYISNKDCARIHTHVRHLASNGTSHQTVKFVLNGEATGEFFGDLNIAHGVQLIDAQQTNRNILLSDNAQMRTRPQLIIYADDVKASHGATTGQLDENALFYMQQRGIGIETAKQMLLKAFVQDVLPLAMDGVVEHVQQRLLELGLTENS